MLCQECRHAGLLNEKGMWMMEQGRERDAEATFAAAEAGHDACRQPKSCTCQHNTGMIRRGK